MSKQFLLFIFLFTFSNNSFSQLITPVWVDTIPGHFGYGYDMELGNDGYVYSTGCISLSAPYQRRMALIKLDKSGNRIWTFQSDTLSVSGGNNGEANAMTIGSDGYIYIAGSRSSIPGNDEDMWVYKIDTSGNAIWDRHYDGPWHNHDEANDVAVDDSGNVYVTGTRENINNFREIVTMKYNSSGTLLWTNFDYVNNTSSSMGANEIKVDLQGNVYVAGTEGYFTSPIAKSRALLISYDLHGNQRWRKTYNPVNNYSSDAKSVEIDGDLNSYISGKASDNSAYIIKYDSLGNQKWIFNFPNSYGLDLELSENGMLYMSGCWWDTTNNGGCDMLLAKVDTSGNQVWGVINGGNNFTYDYGMNLAVDASDNVYLSGAYSDSLLIEGMATLKYSSTGNFLSIAGFPENKCYSLNTPTSTAVDDSGNVFVTASHCYLGGQQVIAIVRYGELANGVNELVNPTGARIFPNPNDGNFSLQFYLEKPMQGSINIYDVSGRLRKNIINQELLDEGVNTISNISNDLENGFYILQLNISSKIFMVRFVIIR